MATWEDVRRIALDLPETSERTNQGVLQWRVKEKVVTWERPLRRADYQALGDAAPEGPILAVWVDDLGVKEALLSDDPEVFFTTPHFDGYAIVLIRLEEIPVPELEELIIEAWLDRAPRKAANEYLKTTG
ncbi:MAG: MmcQ/YjbR family DNA-binding protein [Acidimicrobiia bacterium]